MCLLPRAWERAGVWAWCTRRPCSPLATPAWPRLPRPGPCPEEAASQTPTQRSLPPAEGWPGAPPPVPPATAQGPGRRSARVRSSSVRSCLLPTSWGRSPAGQSVGAEPGEAAGLVPDRHRTFHRRPRPRPCVFRAVRETRGRLTCDLTAVCEQPGPAPGLWTGGPSEGADLVLGGGASAHIPDGGHLAEAVGRQEVRCVRDV